MDTEPDSALKPHRTLGPIGIALIALKGCRAGHRSEMLQAFGTSLFDGSDFDIMGLSDYALNRMAGLKIRSSLALNKVPERGVWTREICVNQLCVVIHDDPLRATDAPVTA